MMRIYWATIAVICLGHAASSRDWIINGREAKPNSRPYMAALYGGLETTRFVCDGFLIREDFVLTAAHCKEKSMIVKLGVHRLSKPMQAWQVIKVKETFTHPKYTLKPMRNDIMLLKLASPAKLNRNVSLLPLSERKDKDERTGMSCFIAGWGTNETGGSPSDVLMEADISITDQKECIEIWSKDLVTANMICARGARKQGICQGDSGGPMVCKKKSIGIASFTGPNCNNPCYPNVYTRVSSYLVWIKQMLKNHPLQ
ncbi:granzyme B(G,H)-like isoform X1 [Erpetoichthys calabaricus]|uniref:granzyme B(G,H)-like isoform X1 n=2 Tax=Erpetoichthys calabaricus TaxID=27687 RepID=UPI00223409A1|nr:granzyme B(G,H)-like isoform X1 [Erpetoichthys calabaricus]